MSDYVLARTIAKAALGRIKRRFGEDSTAFDHSVRVANCASNHSEAIVGILHDVVEDSAITLEDLKQFFDEDIVEAVDLMTHRKGIETYFQYIERIKSSGNKTAIEVKLADLADNSSGNTPESLLKRYIKARQILLTD